MLQISEELLKRLRKGDLVRAGLDLYREAEALALQDAAYRRAVADAGEMRRQAVAPETEAATPDPL